jgi:hypothetical protein
VRVFTPSMAALIQNAGGTPVTLSSPRSTRPAARRRRLRGDLADLQQHRQVAEVTTSILAVSGSVQGHFMNLDYWTRFSPTSSRSSSPPSSRWRNRWDLADRVNDDASTATSAASRARRA